MKSVLTNSTRRVTLLGALWFSALVVGCGTDKKDEAGPGGDESSEGRPPNKGDAGGDNKTPSTPTPPLLSDDSFEPIMPLPSAGMDDADGGACASANSNAEIQDLALAFAFDVSGSMGEGDFPYHNKELKWDPVVAATTAFLESPDAVRVSASMVFFPTSNSDRCDADQYAVPDVPLQQLPSTAFGEAINEIFPDRGGTPTLAVLEATIDYVDGLIADGSTAKHAIVLITDGMPQGCSDEANEVDTVAAAVAAVSERIPVYVIGIANPPTEEEPNPPDNVSSLHQIAVAGGTGQAHLIDTGDATQTVADFNAAIQTIRASGFSCEVAIPDPPAGKTFDKEKVNVSVTTGGGVDELVYSDDCSEASAWHYDDKDDPTRIVLCEQTCDVVKAEADAELAVEFGCGRRTASVK